MKFSIGITLYKPDKQNIELVLKCVECADYLFIFDNSEFLHDYSRFLYNLQSHKKNRCVYISNQRNYGLSHAYNSFLQKSFEMNADALLLLDQDSKISEEGILNLFKKCSHYFAGQPKTVGAIVPTVSYDNRCKKSDEDNIVEYAISSGTCINLRAVQALQLDFDEKIFIDDVDVDFCLNLKKNNLVIIEVHDVFLYQQLGDGNLRSNNHSPIRHYYMFRNDAYILAKYEDRMFYRIKKMFNVTLRHIGHILLFEKNKLKKIQMLYWAFVDLYKGNMGQRSDFSFFIS